MKWEEQKVDWSRAKTIFIITFLILDIFLIYQLINQKSDNSFDLIKEATIDEQLAADEIKLPDLPDYRKDTYVEAIIKQFKVDELDFLEDQEITYVNDNLIHGVLENPISVTDKIDLKLVDDFVKNNIYQGNTYKFYSYNPENNTLTYYQVYQDKMFYHNNNAKVVLNLNEEFEIYSYTQTMLNRVRQIKDQEILTAHEAIVILYNKGYIESGDEVTNAQIGYRTLVPIPTMSSQLLAPTWMITVNGVENYFVNAVEGHIFQDTEEQNQD